MMSLIEAIKAAHYLKNKPVNPPVLIGDTYFHDCLADDDQILYHMARGEISNWPIVEWILKKIRWI